MLTKDIMFAVANMCPVTVLLNVLGQLLVFLSDLAVLLFYIFTALLNCIDVDVHTVVSLGK